MGRPDPNGCERAREALRALVAKPPNRSKAEIPASDGNGALEDQIRRALAGECVHEPTPEVLAAAVELRRLSETPTGRDAAKASEAWNRHSGTCSTCAPWAKAQSKAPRGKYLLAPECAESDRLLAAYQLAAKAHAEAQEKRARLPLVLVAWVEGLMGVAGGGAT